MNYFTIARMVVIATCLSWLLITSAKADPRANSLVDYDNLGAVAPENALGQPYPGADQTNWQDYAVRINPTGYSALDMGEREEIFDLSGRDFYLAEVEDEDNFPWRNDLYEVFDSQGSNNSCSLGQGSGDPQIDGVVIFSQVPSGWFKGNTHTHSTLSDGESPPDEVAARYQSLGYDFLVLTDHNLVSNFSQYSTQDFLCINGEEVTYFSDHHTNGIGLTSTIYRSPSLQVNVDNILAQNGIPYLNHLSYTGLDELDVLPIDGLNHMEVFNGGTNTYDEDIWDRVLSSGKIIYGLASDDAHRLDEQAGKGWIVVRSNVLDLQSIMDAINAGDFYASTGITLNDYDVDSEQMIVDSLNGSLIEFIGPLGQILKSVEDHYGSYQFTGKSGLFNPQEFYVRARISNSSDQYAWTQPQFLADPYADAVVNYNEISTGSPYYALGIPYEGKVPSDWAQYGARIQTGGFLILDMGEDEEVKDREGADLYVEEIDSEDGNEVDDPYHVYASGDMLSWVYLGQGSGDAYFDLAGMLEKARYIRLEVSSSDAEIDGVEANFIDAYADRVTDFDGMSVGYPRYVIGPPSLGAIPSPWENYAVRIDVDGYLVIDLGQDEEAADGPGDDIYIEEVDQEDDVSFTNGTYNVYGSQDNIHWINLGSGTGDGSFDLYGHMSWLRYLKLEPIDSSIEIDGIIVNSVGDIGCEGNFDGDKDTDGSDLAAYIADNAGIALSEFIKNFGRLDCPVDQNGNDNLVVEAENGTLDLPMEVIIDGSASGGQAISVPPGNTSISNPPVSGHAVYTFNVQTAGTYRINGSVIAPDTAQDSFWVKVDSDIWIKWNSIALGTSWHTAYVHDSDNNNTVVEYNLSEAAHTVTVAYREGGTKLDTIGLELIQ